MQKSGLSDTTKPVLRILLGADAAGALPALNHLETLEPGKSHHVNLNKRHPLGIYNISIARICKKIEKCSALFESFALAIKNVDNISEQKALHSDFVDYLELSLYSAAEHIDDIGSLANCFFPTQRHAKKSKRLRDLRRSMKPIRDRLSDFANALKHNQSSGLIPTFGTPYFGLRQFRRDQLSI